MSWLFICFAIGIGGFATPITAVQSTETLLGYGCKIIQDSTSIVCERVAP